MVPVGFGPVGNNFYPTNNFPLGQGVSKGEFLINGKLLLKQRFFMTWMQEQELFLLETTLNDFYLLGCIKCILFYGGWYQSLYVSIYSLP